MKKLIMLSIFALGTIPAFAVNVEKCVKVSSCQEFFIYYEIEVESWYYSGNGSQPYKVKVHTEKGWFTTLGLENRKILLKSQYTDTYANGVGIVYVVFSRSATPPVVPFP